MQIQDADNKSDPPVLEVRAPTNAKFKITDTKLYVPVVTLQSQFKRGFKGTIE